MPRRPRRNHSAAFKAKVALTAIQGDKALSQLAEEFEVHANQIVEWKKHLLAEAASVFGAPPTWMAKLTFRFGEATSATST